MLFREDFLHISFANLRQLIILRNMILYYIKDNTIIHIYIMNMDYKLQI